VRAAIAVTAPVEQQRIAMTAPVEQQRIARVEPAEDASLWRIRFFMPARWTLDSLPRPEDPAVAIVALPPQTVAVLRFSGIPSAAAVSAQRDALIGGLGQSAWRIDGPVRAWFYDPPWTLPPLRRNEVAVAVTPRQG